jgi:hypothetical protein
MTTLYTFDGAGYYTGQRDSADPYAPQPAGTATAPPTAPEGQVPMWTGQAWALVAVPVPASAICTTPDPTRPSPLASPPLVICEP